MCARFTITQEKAALRERFGFADSEVEIKPRYNQAPGQDAAVVVAGRELRLLRWGLVPPWAKEASLGYKMINARAETVADRPAFREAFRRRRCLVLADGFYEWRQGTGGVKQPLRFVLAHRAPFAMAGLWETWYPAQGQPLSTFTIITTQANELVAQVHNRMPVILSPENEGLWLGEGEGGEAAALLTPYPARDMESYPVSSRVNSPRQEGPALIEPVPDQEQRELPF